MVKTLDLHGKRHHEVDRLVENFVLLGNTPMTIVTGKSDRMRELVVNVLDRHQFRYQIPPSNWGLIRIW